MTYGLNIRPKTLRLSVLGEKNSSNVYNFLVRLGGATQMYVYVNNDIFIF